MLDRPNPYEALRSVPSLTVTSDDLTDAGQMPVAQVHDSAGGANISPQLSWSGAPADTQAYAVTMYDPDAPTVSGFWHWLLTGLSATVTSLPSGAGASGVLDGVRLGRNDFGDNSYGGAAPPPGDGPHRYFVAVSALDTDDLGIGPNASAAVTSFAIEAHTIARGLIMVQFEQTEA